jgi:hypothetical protein
MPKEKLPEPKIIYLPSVYDPKKIREGIRAILRMAEELEQKKHLEKNVSELESKKE